LGEADFHKRQGKKTLSRSHDLNTTDDYVGLTEALYQLSCGMHSGEFKIFVSEISLYYF
jgi:hypothetical protein